MRRASSERRLADFCGVGGVSATHSDGDGNSMTTFQAQKTTTVTDDALLGWAAGKTEGSGIGGRGMLTFHQEFKDEVPNLVKALKNSSSAPVPREGAEMLENGHTPSCGTRHAGGQGERVLQWRRRPRSPWPR